MSETTTTEPEVIDVTPEPEYLPAARDPQEGQGAAAAIFGTTDPVEVLEAATRAAKALTAVLEDRKLYKQIGNKKHIYIEGWLMLAGMLQIATPNVWVRPINGDETIGWEARYEARAADGRIISSAEGECRRMEEDRKRNGEVVRKWEHRADHAIRSMAQTRAQSKALASALRWVVELGGFSGTPAEEMTSGDDGEPAADRFLDGAQCPACGSKVYDNRADATPENRRPVYKCANKTCTGGRDNRPWATWDPHYFTPPETRAKQRLYDVVVAHEKGWRAYYELDAPDYTADERALLETIHESGDHGSMAGFFWNRLLAAAPWDPDDPAANPTAHDYAIIVRAAAIALEQAEEEDADLILEHDALDRAGEQIYEEEKEAAAGTEYGA